MFAEHVRDAHQVQQMTATLANFVRQRMRRT